MLGAEGTTERTHDAVSDERTPPLWAIQWVFPGPSSVYKLTGARIVLGRGQGCDVVLAGERVSRHHAELYRQGPIWVLRDNGSTNGTFLDGCPVGHEAIHPGAIIRIGTNVGVVRLVPPTHQLVWREVTPGFWLGDAPLAELEQGMSAAASDLPISLSGETGTGKEMVAQAIHLLSGRTGTFVGVNCAAISEKIAESELFGHAKGSFSGASSASLGYIREASGGTLFLDEVPELPLALQAKLLRVLQQHEVMPVGTSRPIRVELRVIAASQLPLASYVQQGTFREDLMMRLTGLTVHIPPLRERRQDIVPLFQEFLRRSANGTAIPGLHVRLAERLSTFGWPGNVRELELLARRSFALHADAKLPLTTDVLPKSMALPTQKAEVVVPGVTRNEHDLERLTNAIRECNGNLTAAAQRIGLSRMRAYRLLNEFRPDILNGGARRSRGAMPPEAASRSTQVAET